MKLRSVYFISGHKLVDNGTWQAGYNLHCPTKGDLGAGDPAMVATLMQRGHRCAACEQPIGRLSFGSPKPYEVDDAPAEICPGATCEKGDEFA